MTELSKLLNSQLIDTHNERVCFSCQKGGLLCGAVFSGREELIYICPREECIEELIDILVNAVTDDETEKAPEHIADWLGEKVKKIVYEKYYYKERNKNMRIASFNRTNETERGEKTW